MQFLNTTVSNRLYPTHTFTHIHTHSHTFTGNKIQTPNHLGLCRDHYLALNSGHEPDAALNKFNAPGASCLHQHDIQSTTQMPSLHAYAPPNPPHVSNARIEQLNNVMNDTPEPLTGCCYCPCMLAIKWSFRCTTHMWFKRRYRLHHYALHPQRIVRGFIARNRIKRRLIVIEQQKRDQGKLSFLFQ